MGKTDLFLPLKLLHSSETTADEVDVFYDPDELRLQSEINDLTMKQSALEIQLKTEAQLLRDEKEASRILKAENESLKIEVQSLKDELIKMMKNQRETFNKTIADYDSGDGNNISEHLLEKSVSLVWHFHQRGAFLRLKYFQNANSESIIEHKNKTTAAKEKRNDRILKVSTSKSSMLSLRTEKIDSSQKSLKASRFITPKTVSKSKLAPELN